MSDTQVRIGQRVLIMSPTTHYWLGEIVGLTATEVHLDRCAWIPDIGRHHAVVATGRPDDRTEIEPHADGQITRIPRIGSVIIDWPHDLWRDAK